MYTKTNMVALWYKQQQHTSGIQKKVLQSMKVCIPFCKNIINSFITFYLGHIKQKSAFEHSQNVQVHIILNMTLIVLTGP